MPRSRIIAAGAALTTTLAVQAAPALSSALDSGPAATAAMPASWELERALAGRTAAESHATSVAVEKQRKEAERKARAKARAKAKAKAEKQRREAEERAARARAAQGGTPAQNRALGMQMCADRGWSASQCADLGTLWQKESGWSSRAHNGSSGAHGIPQALPGSKMSSHGADWATNPRTQIAWGLDYIAGRYGNPSSALAHSYSRGWY